MSSRLLAAKSLQSLSFCKMRYMKVHRQSVFYSKNNFILSNFIIRRKYHESLCLFNNKNAVASFKESQYQSKIEEDSSLVKSMEQMFSSPTNVLKNFYHLSTNNLKTNFKYNCEFKRYGPDHDPIFICNLKLNGPLYTNIEGYGKSKKLSETAASLKAVVSLFKEKHLDEKGRPSELQEIKKQDVRSSDVSQLYSPIPIALSDEDILSVEELIKEFESNVAPLFQSSAIESESEDGEKYSDSDADDLIINMMTGRHLRSLELETNHRRNIDLLYKLNKIREKKDYSLPIYSVSNEILEAVDKNSVTIIEGGTGCGKSTQIPQMILNQWSEDLRGSECNIVVAQPKRIATFSVADKVASERNEKIGDSIGYKMRLEEKMLEKGGGIMFYTCGTLREMLRLNPLLKGVTHIIIDEIHERSIDTDLLLLLVKRALKQGSAIKVILMSATSKTEDLKAYFDTNSFISVPSGTVFPIQTFYMDEVSRVLGKGEKERKEEDLLLKENPTVNHDLTLKLIRYIHRNKAEGAVLVFLPGWQDIKTLQNSLIMDKDVVVFPLHSKLPSVSQNEIFGSVEEGKRKIILATNIAETSITVSDVVYIIDSGLQNDARYDPVKNISTFGTFWITKANAIQRQGRAGRVQPGEVYRLYDEEMYTRMQDYPQPDMLKLPLETVVLKCKSFFEDMSIRGLLNDLLNPPQSITIEKAIGMLSHLQLMKCEMGGVNERLTPLGRALSVFSTSPFFSKPLIFAALLGCVDSVLNIACLENQFQNLFKHPMRNIELRLLKEEFNYESDLVAIADFIHDELKKLESQQSSINISFDADEDPQSEKEVAPLNQITDFTNFPLIGDGDLVCSQRLQNFLKIRNLLKLQVENCLQEFDISDQNISPEGNQISDQDIFNKPELILSSFLSASESITRRVLNGRTNSSVLLMENSSRVILSNSCVLYGCDFEEEKKDYFFSVDSFHSQSRNMAIARDISSISALSIALFYGEDLEIISSDGEVYPKFILGVKNRNIIFQMDERTSNCVISLRQLWNNIVEYAVETSSLTSTDFSDENFQVIKEFWNQYRSLLLHLLREQEDVNKENIF